MTYFCFIIWESVEWRIQRTSAAIVICSYEYSLHTTAIFVRCQERESQVTIPPRHGTGVPSGHSEIVEDRDDAGRRRSSPIGAARRSYAHRLDAHDIERRA
ncbi:Protein of unknown function [Azospirillum lipoferum 4B]|uniref:Uncharacterized protein n=1 Tax=Azospirillum lipoferum (strain 4B) TaxID=862719 RepID=G7Z3W2_AZOL4|nr:Protein of unknown function [Azospirillum lipoferum 4B]